MTDEEYLEEFTQAIGRSALEVADFEECTFSIKKGTDAYLINVFPKAAGFQDMWIVVSPGPNFKDRWEESWPILMCAIRKFLHHVRVIDEIGHA